MTGFRILKLANRYAGLSTAATAPVSNSLHASRITGRGTKSAITGRQAEGEATCREAEGATTAREVDGMGARAAGRGIANGIPGADHGACTGVTGRKQCPHLLRDELWRSF